MLDILANAGIMVVADPSSSTAETVLADPDFLEKVIQYMNEENLLEPSKRHDISIKGFLIMSLIAKNLPKYPPDGNGLSSVNIAEIKKQELRDGKELFRIEDFGELNTLGYAGNVNIKSTDEAFTPIKPDTFLHVHRLQKVVMGIRAANEQKQKGGR
jgi:hypothetical protein